MMVKQIITFCLLLAFALQTFNKAIIYLDYEMNTQSYASNCENKAMVEMNCKGKCQMMKKLKSEEKKDQKNPDRKAENKKEVFFLMPLALAIHLSVEISSNQLFVYKTGQEIKMPRSVLHPPDLAG